MTHLPVTRPRNAIAAHPVMSAAIAIAVLLTVIFKATRVPEGADETLPHQYTADPVEAPVLTPAGVGLGAAGD